MREWHDQGCRLRRLSRCARSHTYALLCTMRVRVPEGTGHMSALRPRAAGPCIDRMHIWKDASVAATSAQCDRWFVPSAVTLSLR